MKQPTIHQPHPEGRLARKLFGAAFMSDTKWRNLFDAINYALPDVRFARVKFIGSDETRKMHFPPNLNCPYAYMDTVELGPTELRSIEWFEFDVDVSEPLAPFGRFPLTVVAGRSRVTGYGDPHSSKGR